MKSETKKKTSDDDINNNDDVLHLRYISTVSSRLLSFVFILSGLFLLSHDVCSDDISCC